MIIWQTQIGAKEKREQTKGVGTALPVTPKALMGDRSSRQLPTADLGLEEKEVREAST